MVRFVSYSAVLWILTEVFSPRVLGQAALEAKGCISLNCWNWATGSADSPVVLKSSGFGERKLLIHAARFG